MKPDLPLPLAAFLLALAASAPLHGAAQGEVVENPHAFMANPVQCTSCHEEVPSWGEDHYTSLSFTEGIIEICSRCHAGAHLREEHPLEIRPERELPPEFHLDNYYTITCATCHDAHGPHRGDEPALPMGFVEKARSLIEGQTSFPTYFLRRSNARGELCFGCHPDRPGGEEVDLDLASYARYVGSERCGECHESVYREWSLTLHARNFRNAVEDPSAVRGDFDGGEPFDPSQILFTVGEHWTQRYLTESKKGLMVKPQTWSILTSRWLKSGSFGRPWLKYCAGCHTTGMNPFEGSYAERGTGCEGCHGPGLLHTETTDQYDVINPELLVSQRRDMICESCHTSGHDRSGSFRFPVGYRPGEDLTRYFRGLVPKSGQGVESFTGDGSYDDRHRQFLYWSNRVNILVGLACDICTTHSRPKKNEVQQEYNLTPDEMCGTCHRKESEEGTAHSGHERETAGCLDCHLPRLTASGTAYSIHDHKFQFTDPPPWAEGLDDPCLRCHPGEEAREEMPGAVQEARSGPGEVVR